MDIVERLRIRIHTSADETALTNEAADEIERLQKENAAYKKLWALSNKFDQMNSEEWSKECERLRQQNERMKETLQNIASVLDDENSDYQKWALYCGDIASLCLEDIAEAIGGE